MGRFKGRVLDGCREGGEEEEGGKSVEERGGGVKCCRFKGDGFNYLVHNKTEQILSTLLENHVTSSSPDAAHVSEVGFYFSSVQSFVIKQKQHVVV